MHAGPGEAQSRTWDVLRQAMSPGARSPDVEEWGRKAALKDWVPREPRVRRLKCTYPFAVTVERGGWAVRLRCRMDPVALTFQVGSARVVSEGEGVSPQGGPGLLGEGCRPPRSSHEALDVSGGACRPDGTSGAAPVPQRERGADTEGAPAMVASSPNRLAVSGLQARERGHAAAGACVGRGWGARVTQPPPQRRAQARRRRPRPSQETRAALGEWLAARGLDCDVLGYLVSAVFDREQVEFQRRVTRPCSACGAGGQRAAAGARPSRHGSRPLVLCRAGRRAPSLLAAAGTSCACRASSSSTQCGQSRRPCRCRGASAAP